MNDISTLQYIIIKLGEIGQITIGVVCLYAVSFLIYHTIYGNKG